MVEVLGRLAGIDYGTVRIGVAITDVEQRIASPMVNYTRRGEKADGDFLKKLAADEKIVRFVVDCPCIWTAMKVRNPLKRASSASGSTKSPGCR